MQYMTKKKVELHCERLKDKTACSSIWYLLRGSPTSKEILHFPSDKYLHAESANPGSLISDPYLVFFTYMLLFDSSTLGVWYTLTSA